MRCVEWPALLSRRRCADGRGSVPGVDGDGVSATAGYVCGSKAPARKLLRATIIYLPALFALMMANSLVSR